MFIIKKTNTYLSLFYFGVNHCIGFYPYKLVTANQFNNFPKHSNNVDGDGDSEIKTKPSAKTCD